MLPEDGAARARLREGGDRLGECNLMVGVRIILLWGRGEFIISGAGETGMMTCGTCGSTAGSGLLEFTCVQNSVEIAKIVGIAN